MPTVQQLQHEIAIREAQIASVQAQCRHPKHTHRFTYHRHDWDRWTQRWTWFSCPDCAHSWVVDDGDTDSIREKGLNPATDLTTP